MTADDIAEVRARTAPLSLLGQTFTCPLWVKADIRTAKHHVCFTLESGHVRCNGLCLLWANSGHRGIHSISYKYCSIGASPTVT